MPSVPLLPSARALALFVCVCVCVCVFVVHALLCTTVPGESRVEEWAWAKHGHAGAVASAYSRTAQASLDFPMQNVVFMRFAQRQIPCTVRSFRARMAPQLPRSGV